MLKKTAKGSAKRLIVAGTDRLIRSIEGSSIGGNIKKTAKGSAKRLIVAGTDRLIRSIEGSGIGGNIMATSKDSGKRLIVAGTDRAIQAIDGSGIGGSVNRLKNIHDGLGLSIRQFVMVLTHQVKRLASITIAPVQWLKWGLD